VRKRGSDGSPDPEQVDLDRALEGRGIDRAHGARGGHSGVGQKHVDPAETAGGGLHRGLERRSVGDVGLEPRGIGAALRGGLA